jgi:DNA-binding transcriptional MocR family regulator
MSSSRLGSAMFHKLKVGPMKRLYKYYTPDSINLAGGVPMESIFPFTSLDVSLSNGESFRVSSPPSGQQYGLHLNYNRGDGLPPLRDWIKEHVNKLHNPNVSFQTCMTVGSTDAYAKILMLFSGDTVIFDKFAYGTAVATCGAFGRHAVGIEASSYMNSLCNHAKYRSLSTPSPPHTFIHIHTYTRTHILTHMYKCNVPLNIGLLTSLRWTKTV